MAASFTYCDRNFLSRSTLQTVVDVSRQMTHELVSSRGNEWVPLVELMYVMSWRECVW